MTTMPSDPARLQMPIGEAMFSQRSIRRFKPDRIPLEELTPLKQQPPQHPQPAANA